MQVLKLSDNYSEILSTPCCEAALTHKFNFIFLSYKNITFLTAFSWFSESQGIVSP